MRVLRLNKDSVMAMLEAFVHDPLINWRLLNAAEAANEAALAREGGEAGAAAAPGAAAATGAGATAPPAPGANGPHQHTAADFVDSLQDGGADGAPAAGGGGAGGAGEMAGGGGGAPGYMPSPPQRGARERELREARDQLAGDASEVGRGAICFVGEVVGCQHLRVVSPVTPHQQTTDATPPTPNRPTPPPKNRSSTSAPSPS
jgi:hypothetical protein